MRSLLKAVRLAKDTALLMSPTYIFNTLKPSSCISICTACPSLCHRLLLSSVSWGAQASDGSRVTGRIPTGVWKIAQLCNRLWLDSCLTHPSRISQKQWLFKSSSLFPVPVLIFYSQILYRIRECLAVHFRCTDAFFCFLYQICFSRNKKVFFFRLPSGILHR